MSWLRIRRLGEIDRLAREFRGRYLPDCVGPVDIETVAECDLGIRIIPIEGLCRNSGNKAWLGGDGKTICMDEGVQRDHPEELRMSIAHEVAHSELHRHLLPPRPFASQEEFVRFHEGISTLQTLALEGEAMEWAGRVIVPRTELRLVFRMQLTRMVEAVGAKLAYSYFGRYAVEDLVASHFGVSHPCLGVRVRTDRLWNEAKRRDWFGLFEKRVG